MYRAGTNTVLSLAFSSRGSGAHPIQLVFFGYCPGWASTTIARFVYPPAKRRLTTDKQD